MAGHAFVLHQRELGPGRYRYDLLWEQGLRSAALGRSRGAGLQPFRRYACRTRGTDAVEHLPMLVETRDDASFEPGGRGLIAGLYLNEIVVRCLPGQAWLERFAGRYATWLRGLDDPVALPWCLRLAEDALFRELGLGVDTPALPGSEVADAEDAVDTDPALRFELAAGWSAAASAPAAASPGAIRRSQLYRWQALADAFEQRWAAHQERAADAASGSPPAAHSADADALAVLRGFVDLLSVAESETPGFGRAVRDLHRNVLDQFFDGREPLRSRALWRHAPAMDARAAPSTDSRKENP